jgi:DNA-binding transcriptional ArsR family regulator
MNRATALDHIFHALADPTRRAMLTLVARRGDCAAGELGRPFNIAQPTASRHLRVLERAGLLVRRVDGRTHRFRVRPGPLNAAEHWIARHRTFWQGTLRRLEEVLSSMDTGANGK